MQGVRVEKKIRVWCWLKRWRGGKSPTSMLFSLPEGNVSSLPERNKDLQLTRATEKKEKEKRMAGDRVVEKRATWVNTLKRVDVCMSVSPRNM